MTSPELQAAGFEPECRNCREAVRAGREACDEHYVPTHLRTDPRECPGCGGRKNPGDDACGRCRVAQVTP